MTEAIATTETTTPPRNGGGFVKLMRTPEVYEVIEESPLAFALAAVIALRARFMPDVSPITGLHPGEAFLGDHAAYGMSEQQYRTAKQRLANWGFATFKPTSKGTVARLKDSRLFDVLAGQGNEQINGRANSQATDAQRLTKNGKTGENAKNEQKTSVLNSVEREPSKEVVFKKPEAAEVLSHAETLGHNLDVAQKFFDIQERAGWVANGEPIRDWKRVYAGFYLTYEFDRSRKKPSVNQNERT